MKRARRQVGDQAILTAALRVIRRRGPKFTLAQVGREVGLSAARLVQRFGSRRALVQAAFRHWGATTAAMLDTVARSERPVREFLRVTRLSLKGMTAAEMGEAVAWLVVARTDPEVGRWYREHIEGQRARYIELLQAGVAAGELIPHDATALADRIIRLSFGHVALMAIGVAEHRGSLLGLLEGELAQFRTEAGLTARAGAVD